MVMGDGIELPIDVFMAFILFVLLVLIGPGNRNEIYCLEIDLFLGVFKHLLALLFH